jgi:hypothetical protein
MSEHPRLAGTVAIVPRAAPALGLALAAKRTAIAISAIDLEGAARTIRRALRCRRRVRHSHPFLRHPLCKPEVFSGNFCHGTGLRGDVS